MKSPPGWINYCGDLLASGTPLLTSASRAFRYGDGLFETMLVENDHIRLGSFHFDRLFAGMGFLRFSVPGNVTREQFSQEILELCARNGHQTHSRARLVVFRGEAGIFDLDDTGPQYIIESWPLTTDVVELNRQGLVIDIFPDGQKACDPLANLKSNNYLLYVLAAGYARDHGFDDALVLNSHGSIADSAIANLFYVRNGQCYTPPLSAGGVAGVMRRHLLTTMPGAGFPVAEKIVTIQDLLTADEVFLTNALRGIRWVAAFREARYTHTLSTAIFERLIAARPKDNH